MHGDPALINRYRVIELDPATEFGTLIVLDAQRAENANADIIKRYNIPSDRSTDLR